MADPLLLRGSTPVSLSGSLSRNRLSVSSVAFVPLTASV